jgi:predicted aconitase
VSDANEADSVVEIEANLGGTSRGEAVGDSKPLLRVVKGNPTPEELAALVAVVAARSAAGVTAKPKPRSEWGHPGRAVRGVHRPGLDAWRRSAWA